MASVENTVYETTDKDPVMNLDEQFKLVLDNIGNLNSQSKQLQLNVKDLAKQYKVASKPKKVKKHTVMHDPVKVSKELMTYLSLKEGEENYTMASCMKLVSTRIKNDGLQMKENLRQFKPDKKLGKVLNMSPIKVITFVELNKHLRHHYTPL